MVILGQRVCGMERTGPVSVVLACSVTISVVAVSIAGIAGIAEVVIVAVGGVRHGISSLPLFPRLDEAGIVSCAPYIVDSVVFVSESVLSGYS